MTSNRKPSAKPLVPAHWSQRIAPRTALAALGALALFDIAFYGFAVRPAAHGERTRQARNAALAAQVQQARRSVQALQAAAGRIDTADVQGRELIGEIALRRRSAFSELLTELGAAAEQAGVEVRETGYSVEPLEGSEEYGILAVNANFRGRYENLVQLLYRLDRSELFFLISSLGATPRDEANSSELQINMRFDTFVRDL